MRRIPLRNKSEKVLNFAIVDDEDYNVLSKFKWCRKQCKNLIYAHGAYIAGSQKHTLMHKMILWTPKGYCIDHIDGNGLNNRRSNLRIVTQKQNSWNHKKNSNNTSGFLNVFWRKNRNKWSALAQKDGKVYYNGLYVKKDDAKNAAKELREKLFGKYNRK